MGKTSIIGFKHSNGYVRYMELGCLSRSECGSSATFMYIVPPCYSKCDASQQQQTVIHEHLLCCVAICVVIGFVPLLIRGGTTFSHRYVSDKKLCPVVRSAGAVG